MYQRAEQISDTQLFHSSVHLFIGCARLLYQSVYDTVYTWEQLVDAMKEEFLPGNYEFSFFLMIFQIGVKRQTKVLVSL